MAAALCFAVAAAWLGPSFFRADRGGVEDWDQFAHYEVVGGEALLHHGQLPHWNPYACGGVPYAGHPQTRGLSPLRALHLVVTPPLSLQLEAWLLISFAALGAYGLLRGRGAGPAAAAVGAATFALSGVIAGHVHAGHLNLLTVAWLPLIAWGALDCAPSALGVALGAGGVALMILGGGAQVLPLAGVALGLDALLRAFAQRRVAPLVRLAATMLGGGALAAAKLAPVLSVMGEFPRTMPAGERFAPGGPLRALVDFDYGGWDIGGVRSWWEYSAYPGLVALALAVLGAARRPRVAWRPLVALAALVALAWGDLGWAAPWRWLHALPPFDRLRVPGRFLLVAMLPLAELAALGAEALSADTRRRVSWLGWAAAAALVGDLALAAHPAMESTFTRPLPALDSAPSFRQIHGNPGTMAAVAQSGRGTLECYESLLIRRGRASALRAYVDPDYRGEVHVEGRGEARLEAFSPDVLRVRARADAPGALLVVNQHWDRRWRADAGLHVVEWRHLLAVELPLGESVVTLRYSHRAFDIGLAVSAAALLGLSFAAARGARRRAASAAHRA